MSKTVVAGFHASGLYKVTTQKVDDFVEEIIDQKVDDVPVSYGTITEMYSDRFKSAFTGLPHGWGALRLGGTDAEENVLLYDRDVWEPVTPSVRAVQLSTQRIFTEKGKPRPFTTMLEAVLAHVLGGAMTAEGGHWSLANTVNRRISWGLERSNARERWNMLEEILEAQISKSCDLNRNLRTAAGRKDFHSVYNGTSLRSAWDLATIQKGPGTHGSRIIDVNLSNMPIKSKARVLTEVENPFDHRPFGFAHVFDTTRGLAPRRVGPRDGKLSPGKPIFS